jgi:hypothetical protein
VQGGTDSSKFSIPDSEFEGSVELSVPSPQPPGQKSVPSDKILFPRRMLYVEGLLYLTVALAAFGLGYLAGRGGTSAAGKEDSENAEVANRVPIEGKVMLESQAGEKRGDEGAVVIALPAGKAPPIPLPVAGLRPDDWTPPADNANLRGLTNMHGAAAQVDAAGNFSLIVPSAGTYRILIISHHATRVPDNALEASDFGELARYFSMPADLLRSSAYHWLSRDVTRDAKPIEEQFIIRAAP